jgi:pheromone shutdown protein TraB
MITLVGVGHVFEISEQVKNVVRSRHPEVVCLELDAGRYMTLVNRNAPRAIPLQYRLLAYFQKRMAGKFGTEVGDEMMAAAEAAKEIGAGLALIDMDANRMFADLWRRMSFRERLNLLGGAFFGLFMPKEKVEREVERYEQNSDDYIKSMGEGFPTIKEVLIDDRNRFMAQQLTNLSQQHRSIMAIVGDGHVPGLLEALKGLEVEVVRLKDLRAAPPSEPQAHGAEHNVTYWYHYR